MRSCGAFRGTAVPRTLRDENVRDAPLNIHLRENVLLSITQSGHVSAFNVPDARCFRSFSLETKTRTSAVDSDFSVMFVAGTRLHLVDLKRGKIVEEFDCHAMSVGCIDGKAYILTTDSVLIYDYRGIEKRQLASERGVVGSGISVVIGNIVNVYSLDLGYVGCVQGREVLYHGPRSIIVKSGDIEVVDINTMKCEAIGVSSARAALASQTSARICVLTPRAVLVYDKAAPAANMDAEATTCSFEREFRSANHLRALVIAARLGRRDLVRRVISSSFFRATSLDAKCVLEIKRAAIEILDSNTAMALKWLRMCLFEYRGHGDR